MFILSTYYPKQIIKLRAAMLWTRRHVRLSHTEPTKKREQRLIIKCICQELRSCDTLQSSSPTWPKSRRSQWKEKSLKRCDSVLTLFRERPGDILSLAKSFPGDVKQEKCWHHQIFRSLLIKRASFVVLDVRFIVKFKRLSERGGLNKYLCPYPGMNPGRPVHGQTLLYC